MHSVSREVRAPKIAPMLVRLCFDFLGYDLSVSKIFFEYIRMHLYWRLVGKTHNDLAFIGFPTLNRKRKGKGKERKERGRGKEKERKEWKTGGHKNDPSNFFYIIVEFS